jgi:uncharacterized protein with PIN domain
MFGKSGDVKKLKALFDDEVKFNKFRDALDREAQFVLTRRAAQANSTTAKQLSDEVDAVETLDSARRAISDPIEAASMIGRISAKLRGSKASQAHIEALEQAGDILLSTDIKPEKVREILTRGSAKEIRSALERQAKKQSSLRARTIGGGVPVAAGVLTDTQQETQETEM